MLKTSMLIIVLTLFITACAPEKGDNGSQGLKGDVGSPGVPGVAPVITTSPATSQQCLNGGSVVTINSTNTVLCNGINGNAGIQGPAGLPGTQIIPVSFCGGPSVYPSNFPEYGLLIGSQMYGVYSTNGGFLALLPPGTYRSNAVGSSCNFVINSDGTVARL